MTSKFLLKLTCVLLLLIPTLSLAIDFPLSGTGIANAGLQDDTHEIHIDSILADLDCAEEELSIKTEFRTFLDEDDKPTDAYKKDASGQLVTSWTEDWIVSGCNQTKRYRIKYTPDQKLGNTWSEMGIVE